LGTVENATVRISVSVSDAVAVFSDTVVFLGSEAAPHSAGISRRVVQSRDPLYRVLFGNSGVGDDR